MSLGGFFIFSSLFLGFSVLFELSGFRLLRLFVLLILKKKKKNLQYISNFSYQNLSFSKISFNVLSNNEKTKPDQENRKRGEKRGRTVTD
jgi:hypothetical protein